MLALVLAHLLPLVRAPALVQAPLLVRVLVRPLAAAPLHPLVQDQVQRVHLMKVTTIVLAA